MEFILIALVAFFSWIIGNIMGYRSRVKMVKEVYEIPEYGELCTDCQGGK